MGDPASDISLREIRAGNRAVIERLAVSGSIVTGSNWASMTESAAPMT